LITSINHQFLIISFDYQIELQVLITSFDNQL